MCFLLFFNDGGWDWFCLRMEMYAKGAERSEKAGKGEGRSSRVMVAAREVSLPLVRSEDALNRVLCWGLVRET